MRNGFIKVASVTPQVFVADPGRNARGILEGMGAAKEAGAKIAVFPELSITAYTCGDLFFQDALLRESEKALGTLLDGSRDFDLLWFVGMPVRLDTGLYNCAVAAKGGQLLAVIPKQNLPNVGGFFEKRFFSSGSGIETETRLLDQRVPFGPNIILKCDTMPRLRVAAEISEDLWAPVPPSGGHALAGATIVVNLSARGDQAGQEICRQRLVLTQSARLCCGYVCANAGPGESTTDQVFSGHGIIAENGRILARKKSGSGLIFSEIDVGRLDYERRRLGGFEGGEGYRTACFSLNTAETKLTRTISPAPFVPGERVARQERCQQVLHIQSLGLKKRMEHIGAKHAVLGVSGGLDSTLAMLVCARSFDLLGLPRENLIAVTMPGFGTTEGTRQNARRLSLALGAQLREIDICPAVRLHFQDIGHSYDRQDAVFENAQARERTQVIMDLANAHNAVAVGTGDMSELALGWATYNGDHMSMYGLNAGVPKTLVRHLVSHCADTTDCDQLRQVLRGVLATPVSPELLPARNGEISQKTEDLVGPYELHDFFLYYGIRWGFEPEKVLRTAKYAFGDTYTEDIIKKWLVTFYRRFFSQQFKRSCMPDGPQAGTLSLSPRGGWVMPSDASARAWLNSLD